VPEPLRASCREEPALPTGISAGLACAVTGADDLHSFDFGDAEAAGSDYDQRAADAGTSRGAGDCATGDLPAEEPADDGRRLCYTDDSGGHIDGVEGGLQVRLTADAGYSQQLLDAYDTATPR
jgi:hypothetical protein